MKKFLFCLIFLFIVSIPGTAAAPTMLGNEIHSLRALGYKVCTPEIVPFNPEDLPEGSIAGAIPDGYGYNCQAEFSSALSIEDLNWVAWHEACHLATMNAIYDDPDHDLLGSDWVHAHPLFKQCLKYGPVENGGYL